VIYIKLTTQEATTHGGTEWVPGVVNHASGEKELCGPGWLHCYGADTVEQASLLAVLFNPIHGQFANPRLWLAKCGGQMLSDHGLKFGFTEMAVVEELPLPAITTTQKVAFGILCVKQVHAEPRWNKWADAWLTGKDRTETAAARSATAARAWASWAAAGVPARVKSRASASARAARAAEWASWASWVVEASAARARSAASWALEAASAESASWSAAAAVEAVARSVVQLDLGALAAEATQY
jgi:hypothetical protein